MTRRFQSPRRLAAVAVLFCGACANDASEPVASDSALTLEGAPGCEATPPDAPPESAHDVCDELTYENTGAPFFSKYCAVCHRIPQPTFNTLAQVTNFKTRITTRLFQSPNAPMPPPNAPLQPAPEDKAKLQQWLACTPLD